MISYWVIYERLWVLDNGVPVRTRSTGMPYWAMFLAQDHEHEVYKALHVRAMARKTA